MMYVLETDEPEAFLSLKKGVVRLAIVFKQFFKLVLRHSTRYVADEKAAAADKLPRFFVLSKR